MKHFSSIIFPFLIFVFITKFSLTFSINFVEQVLDVNGNPIFPGGKYYILPTIRGPSGGGLRLGKTGNSECEVTVLQDHNEVNNGVPVKFSIPEISPGIIFTGTPIEIEFTEKPNCAESSKWLLFVDDVFQKACVGIGGPENYPDFKTLSGTFNIEKHESGFGYRLGYCVKDSPTCLDIGRSDGNEDEGGSRLILTHQIAYAVVFVDAASYEGGSIKSVA
ncbi:kunitz-type trypsin inhibitor-like 2 protein [Vicia villosa]|uniref:kunitz-type trypsin inhibitor-like 2 protein n=1 Tax=Vicia villosa TaxID=3911 RepID=UPI00273BD92A|nr:kunitz-type trypsin inhibitor-like 2 protein [Vicia villosa]